MLDVRRWLAELIKARHHILEHIEVVGFCGFDDAVEDGAGIGAGSGLAEQPVFSAYHERFNRALSAIVIDI